MAKSEKPKKGPKKAQANQDNTQSKQEVKIGRPSVYTDDLADEICEEIAFTDMGLEHLCRLFPHWPTPRTIHRWIESNEIFRQKYAHARERQAEYMAEQIVSIADDGTNDTQVDEDGKTIVNHDHIARSRLRVEARKWVASKLLPKKYGDRTVTEVTGANGGAIQLEARRTINLENVDEESLQQLEQALKLALENRRDDDP